MKASSPIVPLVNGTTCQGALRFVPLVRVGSPTVDWNIVKCILLTLESRAKVFALFYFLLFNRIHLITLNDDLTTRCCGISNLSDCALSVSSIPVETL